MVQLILDVSGENISLPESLKGGYTVNKEPRSETVEMASGRVVREIRGNRWVINYQYGYFDNETMRRVLSACDKGTTGIIQCGFLPHENDEQLIYEDFYVDEYTRPKFMWSDNGEAVWADFSVRLKAVNTID